MNRTRVLILAVAVMALCLAQQSSANDNAVVVNIDMEGQTAGDTNHVGDDGPLSSAGGTVWNSVYSGFDATNLLDEFGGPTPFGVTFPGGGGGSVYTDPGINNLQESGTPSSFTIGGLVPGQLYDIAVYVGENGGFNVEDFYGPYGFLGFGSPGADGWSLPGSEGDGGDYFCVPDLTPVDLGGGVHGLIFLLDGTVTGVQVSPEPGALMLLALGALAMLRARR